MRSAAFVLALLMLGAGSAAATDRIAQIRERGALNCGIWPHVPGFASGQGGRYLGFDTDVCRAVAAAIFGDASKVRFVAVERIEQFAREPDIDMVVRRLTSTPRRERSSGMVFGPVVYYDGQGFLVPHDAGVKRPADLAGASVCVLNVERHPETLRNYFQHAGARIRMVLVESDKAAELALRNDRCRAYSADITWLAAARSVFEGGSGRYDILPDSISKEPLAPLMRPQDDDLVQLVRWTVYALIEAEELGISSKNVGHVPDSLKVRTFMKVHPGVDVALDAGDWVRGLIVAVGNYGEIFDRNLGPGTAIDLDRGLNRLWSKGGLMYAPPLDR